MAELTQLAKSLGINAAARQKEAKTSADRRAWRRVLAEKLPEVGMQLSPGLSVRLIDLARGGARFESTDRLIPGSRVTVRLVTPDGTLRVPGRVVRSRIARIDGGTFCYDAAIVFDEALKHRIEQLDQPESTRATAPPTIDHPIVEPMPAMDRHDDADLDSLLTMTAVVSQSADAIIDVLNGSTW